MSRRFYLLFIKSSTTAEDCIMAPNKKSLSCVAQSLSNHDLAGMIKSEFLPLTFDAKTLVAPINKPVPVLASTKAASAAAASDDYWNWSAEAATELLTTNEQERYWDEPSEACSSSDNYWDWSANPHAHVVSAAHIESNLTAFVAPEVVRHLAADSESYWDVSSVKDQESRTIYSSAESNDYWYAPNTEEQIKAAFIARILKEESVRQMLSADHVQQQLQHAHTDSYWQWEEQSQQQAAPDHGNYWEWKAEARPVSLAPDNYWDM
jgi:hypothetical protein